MEHRFSLVAVIAVAALAAAALTSCVSKPTPQEEFWSTKFDDKAKAKALVEAGTQSFNTLVNEKGDVDPVDVIEEYFQMALKFDPGNEAAQQMLVNIKNYRERKLRDYLAEARRLLQKTGRKDDETLALLVAVNRALALDGKSEEVAKLRAETEPLRKDLLAQKTAAARKAMDDAAAAASESARDEFLVLAWTTTQQVLRVDSKDAEALKLYKSLENQIGSMVANRLTGVDKLLEAGKFTAAKEQIDKADDLNVRLGGASTALIIDNRYQLYYRWGSWLFDRKDYAAAETRANQARGFKRSRDVTALLDAITEAKNKELAGAQFTTTLADVDKLIAATNLVEAQAKLNSLAVVVKEAEKLAQIDARRKKIKSSMADLYTQGVAAYRAEKFDQAVNQLSVVVAIDPAYEQAKDFLEKARQKKKLLDQY